MRAAMTGDPNYFPNYEDEESGEEESDGASLVGNEPVIGGVAVDEENVFDHEHDENNVLEDVLNQRERDIQEQRAGAQNHNKNKQTRCLKLQNAGME